MKSKQENLTIISNLYPLPWEPNRATFNEQQFKQLDEDYHRHMLIPVAFGDWFKHRKSFQQNESIRYVPYFYLPKIGRRFYSVFLFLSILIHSGFWLKRKKNHILFASWAFPEAVAASWLSKLYKTKFYFKVHGSDINLHGDVKARAKQIIKASQRAAGILSVSKALATEMISMGIDSKKIKVIYNGVNHKLFGQDLDKKNDVIFFNEPYLLFVGNLKKEKGVSELLDGFAKISNDFPTLQLVYAGSGGFTKTLLSKAKEYHLENRVHFLGSINHTKLPALITHAILLALPSYNEGVPNVILEAMACGTAILATNIGGIPEVVNETICGKLIPAKDADAVAEGLRFILKCDWNKTLIKQHSASFSWENNKKELLEFLNTKQHKEI